MIRVVSIWCSQTLCLCTYTSILRDLEKVFTKISQLELFHWSGVQWTGQCGSIVYTDYAELHIYKKFPALFKATGFQLKPKTFSLCLKQVSWITRWTQPRICGITFLCTSRKFRNMTCFFISISALFLNSNGFSKETECKFLPSKDFKSRRGIRPALMFLFSKYSKLKDQRAIAYKKFISVKFHQFFTSLRKRHILFRIESEKKIGTHPFDFWPSGTKRN